MNHRHLSKLAAVDFAWNSMKIHKSITEVKMLFVGSTIQNILFKSLTRECLLKLKISDFSKRISVKYVSDRWDYHFDKFGKTGGRKWMLVQLRLQQQLAVSSGSRLGQTKQTNKPRQLCFVEFSPQRGSPVSGCALSSFERWHFPRSGCFIYSFFVLFCFLSAQAWHFCEVHLLRWLRKNEWA